MCSLIILTCMIQMLDNMRGLLQAAEEKRQASLTELSSKHQQVKCMFLFEGECYYLTSIHYILMNTFPEATYLFYFSANSKSGSSTC